MRKVQEFVEEKRQNDFQDSRNLIDPIRFWQLEFIGFRGS